MRKHVLFVVMGLVAGAAAGAQGQLLTIKDDVDDDQWTNVTSKSEASSEPIIPPLRTAAAKSSIPPLAIGGQRPLMADATGPTLASSLTAKLVEKKSASLSADSEYITVADKNTDLSTTSSTLACGSCGPTCGPSCFSGCRNRHSTGVFGEILYIQGASGDDVAFAMPFDGCDPVTAVPVGAAGVIGQEFEPAFGVGFTKCLSSCSSLRVGYHRFEGSSFAQISTAPNNVIRSLVTHPGTAACAANSLEANADYDIEFSLVDVDYRRTICGSCNGSLIGVFGIRYGNLQQELEVNQEIGVGITTVTTDIDFEGVGLRIGAEGEVRPGGGRFLLYGKGLLNLIAGEFRADYLQFNSFAQTQALTSWEDDRFVPTFDGEIGFGYLTCLKGRNLRLTAGYTVSAWFNAVTTSEYINAVQTNNYVEIGDALVFDGFVARAELSF